MFKLLNEKMNETAQKKDQQRQIRYCRAGRERERERECQTKQPNEQIEMICTENEQTDGHGHTLHNAHMFTITFWRAYVRSCSLREKVTSAGIEIIFSNKNKNKT